LDSSLDIPDEPSWQFLNGYSHYAAARLKRAYALLAAESSRAANATHALHAVLPSLVKRLALPQWLRAYYVVASALLVLDEPLQALEWLHGAFEIAERLPEDLSALTRLLTVRSRAYSASLRYRQAVEDLHRATGLVRKRARRGERLDAPFAVRLLTHEASLRFHLADYRTAEWLLYEARALNPLQGDNWLESATVDWVKALLYRWRGEPERALGPALTAARAYTLAGAAPSAARIHSVVADVALDQAARLPTSSERNRLLEMAQSHLDLARRLAEEVLDQPGAVLVQLIQVRARRLMRSNENRVAQIERLARTANRFHDHALVGQAFTAIGDEWSSLGERQSSLGAYREALAVLDGSDVPALAVWAQRAIRWDQEWHVS
jgi:tetratricopeptide (TPR) repeat protein